MPDQTSPDENLITLWEQMGTSTGSLLGRIIGMTAQYGLQAYEQMVVNPLQQASGLYANQPSETGVPPDIREQTWRKMGTEYGQSMGSSIGMAMDILTGSIRGTVATSSDSKQTSPSEPNTNQQQT